MYCMCIEHLFLSTTELIILKHYKMISPLTFLSSNKEFHFTMYAGDTVNTHFLARGTYASFTRLQILTWCAQEA